MHVPWRRHSRITLCLSALMICVAGCSNPDTPVEISLIPQSTMVFSMQTDLFIATDSLGNADLVWSVVGPNATSPSPTIDSSGTFIAPEVTQNTAFTVTVTSRKDPTKSVSATVTVVAAGQITATNNPQVALYTLTLPAGTTAYIQFGTNTSYALKTWSQPAPAAGGAKTLVVFSDARVERLIASTQGLYVAVTPKFVDISERTGNGALSTFGFRDDPQETRAQLPSQQQSQWTQSRVAAQCFPLYVSGQDSAPSTSRIDQQMNIRL
jgi:hypothetical protein